MEIPGAPSVDEHPLLLLEAPRTGENFVQDDQRHSPSPSMDLMSSRVNCPLLFTPRDITITKSDAQYQHITALLNKLGKGQAIKDSFALMDVDEQKPKMKYNVTHKMKAQFIKALHYFALEKTLEKKTKINSPLFVSGAPL